jgi:hypothetical protein
MRKAPLLATRILERLGSGDEALLGDLLEEYRRGRSRGWYWSQVFAGVALHSTRRVTRQPLRALAIMAAGWLGILALFFAFGDVTTLAILKRGFDWTPPISGGGGLDAWWPLQAAAAAVSFLGFALIAIAVVRVNGGRWAWMLGPFLISIAPAQIAVHAARWYLAERSDTLFYVAPIGLPYERFWAPVLTISIALAASLVAARARSTIDRCTSST